MTEKLMDTSCLVFVGSLNRPTPYFPAARGEGVSVYSFDESSLEAVKLAATNDIDNPTYLSVNAAGSRVYANSEVFGWREGTVSAYSFDHKRCALHYLNKQPALGSITAHNMLTRDGTKLLVSNYGLGEGGPDRAAVVFCLAPDGSLSAPLDSVAHEGRGFDPDRQERSHAHSVTETIASGVVMVADLGLDKLVSYRIRPEGKFVKLAELGLAPGTGPRHMAMHPNGKFAFVVNELASTVISLAIDQHKGILEQVGAVATVPAGSRLTNHCADVLVSADGRFVYVSNRGHDSITTLAVDQHSAALSIVGYTSSGGATPRSLALTPSGRHLLSANQNADCIAIFLRDPRDGYLTDTGRAIFTGTPMCVKTV